MPVNTICLSQYAIGYEKKNVVELCVLLEPYNINCVNIAFNLIKFEHKPCFATLFLCVFPVKLAFIQKRLVKVHNLVSYTV